MSERWSQKFEQDAILKAVENRTPGRFLDIGAYDGIHYSNTYALVERGWSGVMVEPGLEAFIALLANHGGNERVTLVHGAVEPTDYYDLIQFWNNPRTFSTTSYRTQGRFICEGFSAPFYVAAIPLKELFEHGAYDVVSIDTEGTSVNLFSYMLNVLSQRPYVICVEHDGRVVEVREALARHHYSEAYSNEENIVAVRND